MELVADIFVVLAHLAVNWIHYGFCSSALACIPFIGKRDTLGSFLTFAGLGILGLFEFVVCFGAWGGLTSPGT